VQLSHDVSRTIEPSAPGAHTDTGWRAGKPVEDPHKTKRWGLITAKPSEYLVHVRRGRVLERSSGQGATCFKRPWDAVAIVPTSLQQLRFTADQVTVEKVGVEVVGLAVYRIADPLVAFRVLNFSYPERAQQKLEQTLTAMFVGAARRLVANLTVEECLQKRKRALSEELMREIALVVGNGASAGADGTRGWGVVLDTIEIQEVRVMSERVFSAMQAPFRASLDRQAEQARIQTELEVGTKQAELEQAALEARKQRDLLEVAAKREVQEAGIAADAAVHARRAEAERLDDQLRTDNGVERHRLAGVEARAELDAHALLTEAAGRRVERERLAWSAALELRRATAEVATFEGRLEAEVAQTKAVAERQLADARARVITAERLPDLAAAVGQRFGEVKVVQMGSDGNAFGSIAQAVAAVVELARGG
jgi:hypothetical protein